MYLQATADYKDGYGTDSAEMVTETAVARLVVNGPDAEDYAENGTSAVATYVASGADNVQWTVSGDDAGDFNISGGQLTFSASPDFEAPADADMDNVYMVTVVATAGDLTDDQDVTVTVTDVDELGTLAGDASLTQAEGGMDALETYTVSGGTMDDTATWMLEGADASHFMLDGTGMSTMLKFSSAPDYESPMGGAADDSNTYMVTVKASAGGEMEMVEVTIMVTDVDELGPLSGPGSASNPEGTDAVGTYMVSGGDGSTTINWSLDGADASQFMLEGTGMSTMLKFSSAPDYEMPRGAAMSDTNTNEYMVTVKAEAGGEMEMMAVTVMVTNEEEGGTVNLSTMSPVVGSEVTASLTDPDGGITGTTWQWASADAMDGDFEDITGADSASYTPVEDDAGMYLQATASYTDGHGTGKTATSETVMVSAADERPQAVQDYDTNGTAGIQIDEVFDAINDYFDEEISIAGLFEIIDAYFG